MRGCEEKGDSRGNIGTRYFPCFAEGLHIFCPFCIFELQCQKDFPYSATPLDVIFTSKVNLTHFPIFVAFP